MFYETRTNAHGLRHDPFKALIVPRPIGWIGSLDKAGVRNLAPYSFFNAVSEKPHYVVIGSGGRKDTLRNIEETGEFTWSLANYDMRLQMNMTSAMVPADVDEFALADLETEPSTLVKPPRVKGSPAAFECVYWQTVELPNPDGAATYHVVFGRVVGVYVDDRFVKDGMIDTGAMMPLSRLGYMEYGYITRDRMFSLDRPTPEQAMAKLKAKG